MPHSTGIQRLAGFAVLLGATSTHAAEFMWLGVPNGGGTGLIGATDSSCTVAGDTITCPGGGVAVQFDLYVSGWDDGTGRQLRSLQATIDPNSYDNGMAALVPRGFHTPLERKNGAYQVTQICFSGASDGIACGASTLGPFGTGLPGVTESDCQADGGFFCTGNPDFVMVCCEPVSAVGAGNAMCLTPTDCPYSWGASAGPNAGAGAIDVGVPKYLGSLVLEVPSGASGAWAVGFDYNPNLTFMFNTNSQLIDIDDLLPGILNIPTGTCCSQQGPNIVCENDFTQADCVGGWNEGATCSGPTAPDPADPLDCCLCESGTADPACDDGNACTEDLCQDCACESVSNYDNTVYCCDPSDGGLTPIDDGDDCTDDVCNLSTGSVSNPQSSDGTLCGTRCLQSGTCVNGVCEGAAVPETPVLGSAGPRSFTVAPQPAGADVQLALRVTSPDWPCLLKYVDANGTLVDVPVFLQPDEWGTPFVWDDAIVPSTRYEVRSWCGAQESDSVSIDTCLWGDVNCNGFVNFTDIQLIVLAFQTFYPQVPFEALDIDPCLPNRFINFSDIQQGIRAFQEISYYDGDCDAPCP